MVQSVIIMPNMGLGVTKMVRLKSWDLKKDDLEDREGMMDRRMMAVAFFAVEADWPIAKRKGVANYVRKVLTPMTRGELGMLLPLGLQELVDHAAEGYDRFIARRVRGVVRP